MFIDVHFQYSFLLATNGNKSTQKLKCTKNTKLIKCSMFLFCVFSFYFFLVFFSFSFYCVHCVRFHNKYKCDRYELASLISSNYRIVPVAGSKKTTTTSRLPTAGRYVTFSGSSTAHLLLNYPVWAGLITSKLARSRYTNYQHV